MVKVQSLLRNVRGKGVFGIWEVGKRERHGDFDQVQK
jgi:hypothetical protein